MAEAPAGHEDGDGRAGFTLVEMLVALALAALIGVMLSQALSVTGAVAGLSGRVAEAEALQTLRDHLRRTLGDVAGRRPDGTLAPFLGQPDSVSAILGANRDLERETEQWLDLRALPGAAGLDLAESRMSVQRTRSEANGPGPERLLGRLSGLELRYFGSPGPAQPPQWLPDWTRRDAHPDLVELRIAFTPADRRRWAPLLIPVAVRP